MIRMSEQKDMSGDKTLSGGGFNINPVDIIMYLLSKWYWFVLSVSLFLSLIHMVGPAMAVELPG